jgi:hypothetical protein
VTGAVVDNPPMPVTAVLQGVCAVPSNVTSVHVMVVVDEALLMVNVRVPEEAAWFGSPA